MEFVDATHRVPIKSWVSQDEYLNSEQLHEQAANVAEMPNAFHHVALMPDAHPGYGMPIGGVLALDSAICPGAVGYDIGCGMIAVRTALAAQDVRPRIDDLHLALRERIPVGEGGHRSESAIPVPDEFARAVAVDQKVRGKWAPQFGTLGGGNHFIELDSDDEGRAWFVIHSGSRGIGYAIASYYMKLARSLCVRWHTPLATGDLAFLPKGTPEFDDYRVAMSAALDYAEGNRATMADDVLQALGAVFGAAEHDEPINVHHNFASLERHFGRDVWVHRKGATRARAGDTLVIPGNMGQGTVIGTGLGNPDSFASCSHGAGRRLGRNEAKRTLNLHAEQAKLDALGVTLSAGADGALDEMPGAYKDLDAVMEAQRDLVRIDVRLRPIGVVKG